MQKLLSGYIRRGLVATAVIVAVGISACRKEVPSKAHYDTDSTGGNFGGAGFSKRRVLLIGIDGAPGKLIEGMKPSVISSLLPQSVYTWNGWNDTVSTAAAGWTGLTTGINYPLHQIGDSTLIPKSVEGSHAEIKYYNNFVYYLKQNNINTKVTSITQWDDLNTYLLNDADKVIDTRKADGDKGVADAAVTELSNTNPDVLIVNFNSTALAGLQAGFSDNPTYHQAVTDIDGYIGKILAAMKGRKDAANENWLVVIQSTSGGYGKKMGGKTEMDLNTFSIYYSPLITPGQFIGPTLRDVGVRFHGGDPGYVRAENNDGGLYNPGSGNMTIEAKVKFNKGPNGDYSFTYPPFLTKCVDLTDVIPGWSFYRNGSDIVFVMQDGVNAVETYPTQSIRDGEFHTVTATITHATDATNGHTYTANVFVDGMNKGTGSITHGEPTLESPSPLIIGFNPEVWEAHNEVDMYMADVRIWNEALPDDVVKKYAFVSQIDNTHPYYKNLIGNWLCDDKSGNKLLDSSPSKKDFTIVGNYTWDFLGANLIKDSRAPAPSITDVVPSILSWVGITLQGDDKPAGKNWLQVIGTK